MSKKAQDVINGYSFIHYDNNGGYAKIDEYDGVVTVRYGRDGFPPHSHETVEATTAAVDAKMKSIADLRRWVEPTE